MTWRDQSNEARREIMEAIRRNLKASAPYDAVRAERGAHAAAHTPSRPATVSADETGNTKLDRFQQALEAVAGQYILVHSEEEAAGAIERIVESEKARRVAISDAAAVQSVIRQVRADVEWIEMAAPSELFECDIGITTAQWGIVETGTLVLESERERHRLLSLVPPAHIALLEASRICLTLGEALAAVRGQGTADLSPTITLITGPSRTSDIELTLAIGVHGPQALYVIVLDK